MCPTLSSWQAPLSLGALPSLLSCALTASSGTSSDKPPWHTGLSCLVPLCLTVIWHFFTVLPSPALDLSLSHFSLVTSQDCLPALDLCHPLFSGDFTALPSNTGPLSPSVLWWLHRVAVHHWPLPPCYLVTSQHCPPTLDHCPPLSTRCSALWSPFRPAELSRSLSRPSRTPSSSPNVELVPLPI